MIRRKKHNRKKSRLYIPFRRLFIEELSSRIVLSSDSYSSHEDLIVSSNQKLAPRQAEFSVDGKIHGEGEIDEGGASSKIEECTLRAAMMQAIAGSSKGHSITFVNAVLQDTAFIVNSIGDEEDNDTTDGVCWTGGYVSSVPAVGSHMLIQPSKALPIIASPIIIQGAVRPHLESLNTVNGSKAIQQPNETSISAFQIEPGGKGTSISNLAINGWSGNGVVINSSSTSISGNFIGVDANGTTAVPNGKNGVLIAGGTENSIGQNQWNVISGNTLNGISIEGGSENHIPQSYIGTDRWGEYDIPNGKNGVEVGPNAGKNNIGSGPIVLCRWFFGFDKQDPCTPVVSGNKLNGVFISGNSSAGSTIYSSRIGTDRDGNGKIPNLLNGVKIQETPGVEITQNVISGNTIHGVSVIDSAGVKIETNRIGTNILGNGPISGSTQQEGILVRNSNDVSIIANVISGNKHNGVHLTGSGNNAKISENNIGMDNLGDLAIANEKDGILIEGNSGGHLIGFHNLISGNKHNGIRINGGTGTRIQGNLIGTNLVTQASRPNEHNGILIEGDASNIVIGIDDSEPPEGPHDPKNIIAGNKWSGIYLDSSVSKARIAGNDIGFEATVPFGNGKDGITVLGPSNTIGSNLNGLLDDEEGNSVRYNALKGVRLQGSTSNSASILGNRINHNSESGIHIENSSSNKLGRLGTGRNVIWSNSEAGIDIRGSNSIGNIIDGNFIGTESDGKTVPATPQNVGVKISGMAQSNRIGVQREGMFWTQSNVLSGNKDAGVLISNASFNYVYANRIGLGDDMSMVGNQGNGVRIESGVHNEVGHSGNNAYNLISGNDEEGVLLAFGASSNSVRGNFIGYDWLALESEPKPNRVGVRVAGATNNQILDNKIGLNLAEGIVLDSGSSSNTIDRNIVRKNRAGGVLVSNSNENIFTRNEITENGKWTGANLDEKQGNGLTIRGGATKNHIGKIGLGNTIDMNFENGVLIEGANENYVVANTIGGDGNGKNGVKIENGSSNQIGAPATGGAVDYGNMITKNAESGVFIQSGTKNPIRLNSIYENGRLGIDLYAEKDLPSGVTRNDALDSDPGANELQNFPTVSRDARKDTEPFWDVDISLKAKADQWYTIDLYYVPIRDVSGFGEGKEWIKSNQFKTDEWGRGKTTLSVHKEYLLANGDTYHLSATATDSLGNTSEFSGREMRIFYGIDGTGSAPWLGEGSGCSQTQSGRWNSHTKNLYEEFKDSIEYSGYVKGPAKFTTGSDSPQLKEQALTFITKSIENAKERGIPNPPIALAGWSRGAQIALWVANELGRLGHDVDVVGLYDPVDMATAIPDEERVIHTKVKQVQMFGPLHNQFINMGILGAYVQDYDAIFGVYDVHYLTESKNLDWRFFVRASHKDLHTLSGVIENSGIHLPAGSNTKLEPLLLDASHGAIGGTPGFNEDNSLKSGFFMWGEDNPNDSTTKHTGYGNTVYDYKLDVENSIKADRHIRKGFEDQGWPIRKLTDGQYGFPDVNPPMSLCAGDGLGLNYAAKEQVKSNSEEKTELDANTVFVEDSMPKSVSKQSTEGSKAGSLYTFMRMPFSFVRENSQDQDSPGFLLNARLNMDARIVAEMQDIVVFMLPVGEVDTLYVNVESEILEEEKDVGDVGKELIAESELVVSRKSTCSLQC